MSNDNLRGSSVFLSEDPSWHKDAVIYELHVKAFHDSNGDGIGDFVGLTQKLDYIASLGVTAIWLLPFYPSPFKDDGYDIADYRTIHGQYGTLKDFRNFLREAHRRGLRVITELVVNHTSDQHPWFQAARRAKPGSAKRNYYVWTDDPTKFSETRVIFCDTESSNWAWDPVAKAYYWHRFYSHQPDLNLNNPRVVREVIRIMRFWLDLGVDGLRLDAVPYLCVREGTNNENLPETHQVIKTIRKEIDTHYTGRVLLAEANQWPQDVREYFGDGDECHMAFHFPLMPRIFIALRREDREPIVEIMRQTPEIPESCQWSLFLRNHDELTLEMVSDEERDYLWSEYATDQRMRLNLGIRRRLAPLVENSPRRLEMLNSLLLSFPGTPVIYYGDELGMGDNIYLGDRDGVRTPMQWSSDRNAGFSRTDPARLYLPLIMDPVYGYQAVNVEAQQRDSSSFLSFMKRTVSLRRQYRAFGRGTLWFIDTSNSKVLAYIRRYRDEVILCVVNLSRFSQPAEFSLSEFTGWVPMEMFGRTEFPAIGELPYFITLGPHSFYWFKLEPESQPIRLDRSDTSGQITPETLMVNDVEADLFVTPYERNQLSEVLQTYVIAQTWYVRRHQEPLSIQIDDIAKIGAYFHLIILKVEYDSEEFKRYFIPVRVATGAAADRIVNEAPSTIIALVKTPQKGGILVDALGDQTACHILLSWIHNQRQTATDQGGRVEAQGSRALDQLVGRAEPIGEITLLDDDQSSSWVRYGQRLTIKFNRQMDEGIDPDLEIGLELGADERFSSAPRMVGWFDYFDSGGRRSTLGVVREYRETKGSAWLYFVSCAAEFCKRADASLVTELMPTELISEFSQRRRERRGEILGDSLFYVELLGKRLGELHSLLLLRRNEWNFRPEPLTESEIENECRRIYDQIKSCLDLLRRKLEPQPEQVKMLAELVVSNTGSLLERLISTQKSLQRAVQDRRLYAVRCHGDFHLGRIELADEDLVISDFSGEPFSVPGMRRSKRAPQKDVATMMRSFSYAAYVAATSWLENSADPLKDSAARLWALTAGEVFRNTYRETIEGNDELLFSAADDFALLELYRLDKLFYELRFELRQRPEWVEVPLRGIRDIIRGAS